ncbi:MAG: spore germination protein GerW family protein [Clostridia bacterium]|nr:spore germination protein GerW family protein [Clostridia bacterium]
METEIKNKIESIIECAVSNLKKSAEVNTVLGSPIPLPNNRTIIPVNKLSFAFVAGGGEYSGKRTKDLNCSQFAGGSGGGATLTPIGFLYIGDNKVKMIKSGGETGIEKILEGIRETYENVNSKQ